MRLEADTAPRLGRLLLAPSLAYGLAVLLGALSIGILAPSQGRFVNRARDELHRLLAAFQHGVPATEIPR